MNDQPAEGVAEGPQPVTDKINDQPRVVSSQELAERYRVAKERGQFYLGVWPVVDLDDVVDISYISKKGG